MSKHTIHAAVEVHEEKVYSVRIFGHSVDWSLENRREIEKRINLFPDMLEALKLVQKAFPEFGSEDEDAFAAGHAMAAAIKKAESE